MSWHHVHHVRLASPLTGALYAVHRSLADFADEAGVCWPSHTTLARDARVSRRSVIDALQALEEHGLLRRQRTPGKYNSYTLALGSLDGCTYCTSERCAEAAPVQRLHTPCAEAAPESPENPQKDPDPDARTRPPRGQSGTSPDPAILPEKDDAPDVQGEDSVGCPPAAAALAVVAPLQQAPESVEGEPPAPEQPAASASPCAEPAARPEVPAEPLAASQSGVPGDTRADGACAPGTPPAFGRRYVPMWHAPPREVGARALPAWLLAFEVVRKYGVADPPHKELTYV